MAAIDARPLIAVHALGKAYDTGQGPVVALHDIEFGVAEGAFVAVVGPSGCGKSTLLRILAGLDAAQQRQRGAWRGSADRRARGATSASSSNSRCCSRGAPCSETCCWPIDVQHLGRAQGAREGDGAAIDMVGLDGLREPVCRASSRAGCSSGWRWCGR